MGRNTNSNANDKGTQSNCQSGKLNKSTNGIKHGRSQSRRQSKPKLNKVENDSGRGSNDIVWYSKNPNLLKSAGSIPFTSVLGSRLPFAGSTSSPKYVPGVMRIKLTPTIGGNLDADALNQCAASMYSYLVHANSRNYVYTQTDLMLIVLSGALIFSEIARAIRAYGIAKYYQELNMYAPRSILHACGFDPDTFVRDLGRIWFDLNQIIAQTSQIWIPNTLPLIQRWFWLNSNVFMDANDVKGQMYVFDLDASYEYMETLSPEGGSLVHKRHGDAEQWHVWLERIQTMIDSLIASEDRGIMFGDILNAYGKENIYALPPVPLDYRIEPVYNPEVLSQIENCTTISAKTGAFFQKSDNKVYTAYEKAIDVSFAHALLPDTPVLNMHISGQPSPEAIMVATRLTSVGVINGQSIDVVQWGTDNVPTGVASETGVDVSTCGTERVYEITIYKDPTSMVPAIFKQYVGATSTQNPENSDPSWMPTMAFDWHPFCYHVRTLTGDWVQGADVINAYGDYANYTIINPGVATKLHSTALMSLFGVPQI